MKKAWALWTAHESSDFKYLDLVILPERYATKFDVYEALQKKGYLPKLGACYISILGDENTLFVSHKETGKPLYNLYGYEHVH